MPTEVKGALELRKAIRKFSPELAKETRKELASLLAPIVKTARGFIPSQAPISGWGKASSNGRFPEWSSAEAKRGIGYKTTPSRANKAGWSYLVRIVNASAGGAIYETAGRKNKDGQPNYKRKSVVYRTGGSGPGDFEINYYEEKDNSYRKGFNNSLNPNAGKQFINSLNSTGQLVNARPKGLTGNPGRKSTGRAIYRAWAEDEGKANAAVLKAIETAGFNFQKKGFVFRGKAK
jgi:hypothetical protein